MLKKRKINIPIDWGTDAEGFKHYVGRYPKDLGELVQFAYNLKKAIESQIDFDICGEVASEDFK
jgi:hypothetical protein